MADDLKARLRQAAEAQSETSRMMAETKSLRQHDCDPPRADLYMWQTPEQTVEGKALARIEALEAAVEKLLRCLMPVTMGLAQAECVDEPLADGSVVLSFMGSGASDQVTAGEVRAAIDAARAALGEQGNG